MCQQWLWTLKRPPTNVFVELSTIHSAYYYHYSSIAIIISSNSRERTSANQS